MLAASFIKPFTEERDHQAKPQAPSAKERAGAALETLLGELAQHPDWRAEDMRRCLTKACGLPSEYHFRSTHAVSETSKRSYIHALLLLGRVAPTVTLSELHGEQLMAWVLRALVVHKKEETQRGG